MSAKLSRLLEDALSRLQGGDLAGAERAAERALRLAPRHADALQVSAAVLAAMGRPAEALARFRAAAAAHPGDPQALYNLGRALADAGLHADALEALDRAARHAPGDAEIAFSRAHALLELRRWPEAVAAFDGFLARAPGVAAGWFNRGNALMAMDDFAAALASYERALALDAGAVQALVNRGVALRKLGRRDESLEALLRAVREAPDAVAAWSNLGDTQQALGRHAEAIVAFDRALALAPRDASIWSNRGVALREARRHEDALAAFERALEADPARADVWSNRGNALSACGATDEALASYERALALAPDYADAWRHRGGALTVLERHAEAIESLDRALALDPASALTWAARAGAHAQARRFDAAARDYAEALARDPDTELAAGGLLHARLMGCDWEGLERLEQALAQGLAQGRRVALPFVAAAVPLSRAAQRRAAELNAELSGGQGAAAAPRPPRSAQGRLRVGYLSADFREHPVGLQVLALLAHHDRARIEPVALSIGPSREGDACQARMRAGFSEYLELHGLPGAAAAERIVAAGLDLVVDLTGHMDGQRMDVLARRVAPLQASLYCPTTSGAPWIDYLIADAQVVPEAHAEGYSEQRVTVPVSYFIAHHRELPVLPGATRAEEGLPPAGLVFASFCEAYKIRPEVWAVWMRLLAAVPASVLWLAIRDNDAARERLRARAAQAGIDPSRLVFARVVRDRQGHLSRLGVADLCLDTPVYNGHTTTADALWAGVPVVTCPGECFSGRIASSLVLAAGLPELVAEGLEGYEALALALARDPARLAGLRRRLEAGRGSMPLFDAARCVRHLEAAFEAMVDRQRRGLAPAPIEIAG